MEKFIPNNSNESLKEIILNLGNSDAGLTKLYPIFIALVIKVAKKILTNEDDAYNVMHDTFMKLTGDNNFMCCKDKHGNEIDNVNAYIKTVIYNECINFIRSSKKQVTLVNNPFENEPNIDHDNLSVVQDINYMSMLIPESEYELKELIKIHPKYKKEFSRPDELTMEILFEKVQKNKNRSHKEVIEEYKSKGKPVSASKIKSAQKKLERRFKETLKEIVLELISKRENTIFLNKLTISSDYIISGEKRK